MGDACHGSFNFLMRVAKRALGRTQKHPWHVEGARAIDSLDGLQSVVRLSLKGAGRVSLSAMNFVLLGRGTRMFPRLFVAGEQTAGCRGACRPRIAFEASSKQNSTILHLA